MHLMPLQHLPYCVNFLWHTPYNTYRIVLIPIDMHVVPHNTDRIVLTSVDMQHIVRDYHWSLVSFST